jgi:hypothetical protein
MSVVETTSDAAPEQIRVAKWNGSKVKIALDDVVREAVLKRGFVEDFTSTDMKLLATSIAVAIAAYGIYYRYVNLFPFNMVTNDIVRFPSRSSLQFCWQITFAAQ